MLKVGWKVKLKSNRIEGVITFIDFPELFNDHMCPVQVQLERPYDDSGHLTLRTSLSDLRIHKSERPRK